MKNKGLTLIEIVIVLAILALLFLISMMSWRNQLAKARDAQRKEDLQRISIAFEEYFSDNNCYPPAQILQNCSGPELNPYLDKIPCDPTTNLPYEYLINPPAACPRNYRIFASLDNTDDPAIAARGCSDSLGCGWGNPDYNYGISSTNVAPANPIGQPGPSSSPAGPQPSASPKWYYCQDFYNCTETPPGKTCNPAYRNDPNCGNPSSPCNGIISTCN